MKVVVVTGTAGAFPRLVEAMMGYARAQPDSEVWIQFGHYTGPTPHHGQAFSDREDVLRRMAAADVVVCHGGSGTIRDALTCGHVPVVVPRLARLGEHIDDHQLDVANALAASGRVLVAQPDALPQAIEQASQRRGLATARDPGAFCDAVVDAIEARARSRRRRTRLLWPLLSRVTRRIPITLTRASEPGRQRK